MMDMHYGQKRDPIHLYKLEMAKIEGNQLCMNSELKSDPSIDRDLYSNQDIDQSTSLYLPPDQSPRVSIVQFTEPLVKRQESVVHNTLAM